jgi:hypothetical protein
MSEPIFEQARLCLEDARRMGVSLWVEAGDLKYECEAGGLDPSLRERLARNKGEVLRLLEKARAARQRPQGGGQTPKAAAKPRPVYRVTSDPAPLYVPDAAWRLHEDSIAAGAASLVTGAIPLQGDPDIAALREAVALAGRRHDVLAMTARDAPGRAWEHAGHDLQLETNIGAASDGAGGSPDRLADRKASAFHLNRLADGSHELRAHIHSLFADKASVRLVLGEIIARAGRPGQGGEKPPLPRPVQLAHYFSASEDWLASPAGQSSGDYWRKLLDQQAGASRPVAEGVGEARLDVVHHSLDRGLALALAETGQEMGLKTTALLLAAQVIVARRRTGADLVWIDLAKDGRDSPVLKGMVGRLGGEVPILMRVRDGDTYRDLLQRAKQRLQQARGNALPHYVLEKLVSDRGLRGLAPRMRFVEGRGLKTSSAATPDQAAMRLDVARPYALHVVGGAHGLDARLSAWTSASEGGRLDDVWREIQQALEAIAWKPDTAISLGGSA